MPDNRELIEAWKRLALHEHPDAAKLPGMTAGTTEDEIMESARRAAEVVQDIRSGNDDTFERARAAYGPAPVGGSSAGVPSAYTPPDMAKERWNQQFAERFNNADRDAYGMRLGISARDITRYTNNRFIAHVKDLLAMSAGMTRSDQGYRNPQR